MVMITLFFKHIGTWIRIRPDTPLVIIDGMIVKIGGSIFQANYS
jgi:hypothetical protein